MSDTLNIKQKLSIVDVISGYLKLESSGINFRARCPFHNEKTPSFFISPERGTYYCFGCGVKGDIFSFVEFMESTDFKGALTLLAEKAGITLSGERNTHNTKDLKDSVYQVLERATVFFEECFLDSKESKDYLLSRGVIDTTRTAFRLGYAKKEWKSLFETLTREGYSKEVLIQAGLIKEHEGKVYDRFRDRIMFPISDSMGRIIGFSGRILHDDGVSAKYLNSPETVLFKKSEVLYGIDKARDSIKTKGYSILVEGQLDLVLSHQVGITNTVASSGTALSDTSHDQHKSLTSLFRLSPKVVFAFDGDAAGVKAVYRGGSIALKQGFDVKVVTISNGRDPADIIKQDPTEWFQLLKKTESIIMFFTLKGESESHDTLSLGKYITEYVAPLIACLSNPLDRDHYIDQVAWKTHLNKDSVATLVTSLVNNQKSNVVATLTYNNTILSSKDVLSPDKELYLSLELSPKDDLYNKETEKLRHIIGNENYDKLVDSIEEERDALLFKIESIRSSIKNISDYHTNLFKDVEKMVLTNQLQDIQNNIILAEKDGTDTTELIKIYQEKRRLLESLV